MKTLWSQWDWFTSIARSHTPPNYVNDDVRATLMAFCDKRAEDRDIPTPDAILSDDKGGVVLQWGMGDGGSFMAFRADGTSEAWVKPASNFKQEDVEVEGEPGVT